jgi:glycosyltransferase involved in cell wall biosynthesis
VHEVIYNGVDLSRFKPHRGGKGTQILAVGRCVPQKGFDLLVQALPQGVSLDIVGEGPLKPPHPQVRYLGRQESIPDLLSVADMLVVPSRWEGFGLVALEGMAAGVPVIASDLEGLREVVGEAGLLVEPGNVAALREAILRLIKNPAERAELGTKGKTRAEQFSLQKMLYRYQALYREALYSR